MQGEGGSQILMGRTCARFSALTVGWANSKLSTRATGQREEEVAGMSGREWKDGSLSQLIRKCSRDPTCTC